MTLADIGSGLQTRLQSLLEADGGPLRTVGWYSGGLSRDGVDEELLGEAPSALLSLDGEQELARESVKTLALGVTQTAMRSLWTVYVVILDPRGEETAHVGSAGSPGALEVISSVQTALTGYDLGGLLREGIGYLGCVPAYVQRGVAYVYALRFCADYAPEQYDPAASDASPDLTALGGIDLYSDVALELEKIVEFTPELQ